MKTALLITLLTLSFLANAQAHLGATLSELRDRYPDKYFSIDYTNDGTKYTTADQPLGTFVYYFDPDTWITTLCIQIPNNMVALNTQVEIYNNKYVVISETKWKAYLEGGGVMNIDLIYNDSFESYIFVYTD